MATGSGDEMSTPRIKSSRLLLSWRGPGEKQRKCDVSSEWAERALGNRDHPLIRDGGETDGPMGGRDGGQGPIRARQCDLHSVSD